MPKAKPAGVTFPEFALVLKAIKTMQLAAARGEKVLPPKKAGYNVNADGEPSWLPGDAAGVEDEDEELDNGFGGGKLSSIAKFRPGPGPRLKIQTRTHTPGLRPRTRSQKGGNHVL